MTSINTLLNNYPHFIQHPDELLSLNSSTLQTYRIYIASLQNGQNKPLLDYLDSVICQAIDLKKAHHHIRNGHQAPREVSREHTISRGIVDPSTRRVQQIYSAKRARVELESPDGFKRSRYCEPMNVS